MGIAWVTVSRRELANFYFDTKFYHGHYHPTFKKLPLNEVYIFSVMVAFFLIIGAGT